MLLQHTVNNKKPDRISNCKQQYDYRKQFIGLEIVNNNMIIENNLIRLEVVNNGVM